VARGGKVIWLSFAQSPKNKDEVYAYYENLIASLRKAPSIKLRVINAATDDQGVFYFHYVDEGRGAIEAKPGKA